MGLGRSAPEIHPFIQMTHADPVMKLGDVPQDDWNHCGRTSKTAISRGCKMEPLFYGFMPAQCVFDELTAKFPVFETQKWFRDKQMAIPVSSDELVPL